MSNPNMIETMNDLLGSNYQVFANGITDPIILSKLPNEDLASNKKPSADNVENSISQQSKQTNQQPQEKTMDDYLFQIYLGSLTVVGLFILFRMIQKSK